MVQSVSLNRKWKVTQGEEAANMHLVSYWYSKTSNNNVSMLIIFNWLPLFFNGPSLLFDLWICPCSIGVSVPFRSSYRFSVRLLPWSSESVAVIFGILPTFVAWMYVYWFEKVFNLLCGIYFLFRKKPPSLPSVGLVSSRCTLAIVIYD